MTPDPVTVTWIQADSALQVLSPEGFAGGVTAQKSPVLTATPTYPHCVNAIELARQDLRDGRPWMARDRLLGTLGTRRGDAAALDLLGEVHTAMNDLPAAGAAWFLTARSDEATTAAGASFKARYAKPPARVERLPMHRPLAEYPPEAIERVKALQSELKANGWSWHPPAKARPPGRNALRRRRDSFRELEDDYQEPERTWHGRLADIAVGAFFVYMVVAFFAIWVLGVITFLRWVWT